MKRRNVLQWGMGLGLGLGMGVTCAAEAADSVDGLHWEERMLQGLGTTLHLRAAHRDVGRAAAALDAAVADIRRLEDMLSLFRPDSLVSQLNRNGALHKAPIELLQVLRVAQTVSQHSTGAFDVTVQPLWRVFETAAQHNALPARAEVDAARRQVGWQRLAIAGDTVTLAPGTALTLNGIAQGYIADKVRARLQQYGVNHALVDTGEWAPLGKPGPDADGATRPDWVLGLANPRQGTALLGRIALQGLCAATSADDQCSFSADHRYHHILNPHTGWSPPEIASVTVLAKHCVMADALTKVLFMAGFERATRVAQHWQVQAIVVSKQGALRLTPGLQWLAA